MGDIVRSALALALGMCALSSVPSMATAADAPTDAQPEGFWEGNADTPVPAALDGARVVHVKEVAALLRESKPVVIDVSSAPRRPAELAPGAPWLPLPHRALPTSRWFPGLGAGAITPAEDDFFRTRLAAATAADFDAPVIVYCHEKCWLSWNAAKRAVVYGYRRVYWFTDGIEGWSQAGENTVAVEPQAVPEAGHLPRLAILDLELTGDLGGPDFAAEHEARLKTMSARLRQDMARTGQYEIVDVIAAQSTIDTLRSEQAFLHDCNGCDLDVGRQLHADLVMVAWVYRVSGLILTLTYEIHDVGSSQILARKSFDFRGDNDNAWNHAIDYMVRHLRE